eukprot:1192489-Prorocentrum_minimum.AAC.1
MRAAATFMLHQWPNVHLRGVRCIPKRLPLTFQHKCGLSSSRNANRRGALPHTQRNVQKLKVLSGDLDVRVEADDTQTLLNVLKGRGVTDEQFALILERNPDVVNSRYGIRTHFTTYSHHSYVYRMRMSYTTCTTCQHQRAKGGSTRLD